MNNVVSQRLRCIIHDAGSIKKLGKGFANSRFGDYSLPNQSTELSPFFLNYGNEPVTPIQLLKGNEEVKIESVASFVHRATSNWTIGRENLKRPIDLQVKHCNRKHRDAHYDEGDLVLLSTKNLIMKGILGKLQKRFVRPFAVEKKIRQQA